MGGGRRSAIRGDHSHAPQQLSGMHFAQSTVDTRSLPSTFDPGPIRAMTASSLDRPPDEPSSGSPGLGLRLRLWLACLAGALVAGGGMWWVIGTKTGPSASDVPALIAWMAAVAGLGIVVGAAFALWLDHGLVVHLRGLIHGVTDGQVARLRGLPAASGWGELSLLTQRLQVLLTQHRQAARSVDDLGLARDQLSALRQSLERWNETERWQELRVEAGPVGQVVGPLNRGLKRFEEVREQNLEAARQISGELERAFEVARESANQAARGFTEATGLLTSVRDLERAGAELAQAWSQAAAEPGSDALAAYRTAAREAIEELVESSTASVEQVVSALSNVQEITDQVALLANRATFIALHAAVRPNDAQALVVDPESDMKQLADQVRAATARTATLTREIEAEVAGATARMRGVRERVANKLDRVPAGAAPTVAADTMRLLERVREMIQDVARKSERLASAGERVSRDADGLARDLEEERSEMEGMVIRLSTPEEPS